MADKFITEFDELQSLVGTENFYTVRAGEDFRVSADTLFNESKRLSNKNVFLVDYNDTSSQTTPVALSNGVWTDVPNDGLGPFSQTGFMPDGFNLLENGSIVIDDFRFGGVIMIRNDLLITPAINGSRAEFRYQLGTGLGTYHQVKHLGPLNEGAGVEVPFGAVTDLIYAGDSNTVDNEIKIQVRIIGGGGTVVNRGFAVLAFNPEES